MATIHLTVWRALKEDIGKRRVRINKAARDALVISPGQSVFLQAGNRSLELPAFSADKAMVGRNVCRLDESARNTLGLDVGSIVTLSAPDSGTIAIKATIDTRKYDIVVIERAAENPFQISGKLAQIALTQSARARSPMTKAKALFDWIEGHVRYGSHRPPGIGYRDSIETKIAGEGVCGEMAFLYVAVARVIGLVANFVIVERDDRGQLVNHACAAIRHEDRLVLVDPAYHTFSIAHQKYRVLNDLEAHEAFRSMRSSHA